MEGIITAESARNMTNDINSGKLMEEIKNISNKINKSINNGEYSCRVERMSDGMKDILRSQGYTVDYFSDQREMDYWYDISWK